MIEYAEALPVGDTGLQRFDALALKFHDFATDQADQVVMVLALGAMFKTGDSVAKLARGRPPALGHQLQRAVNSGISNPRIPLANPLVNLSHT